MIATAIRVRRRRVLVAAGAAAFALSLSVSGCSGPEVDSDAAAYHPAQLQPIGTEGLQKVTFTADAAKRVGLQTGTARQAGRYIEVDYAALIYDGKGVPWVYTVPRPLTFVRAKVVVDRIEGGRVLISKGLAPGTEVVTVGATQVYGAELEIEGGH